MVAVRLEPSRRGDQFFAGMTTQRNNRLHFRPATGERSGLVHSHGTQPGRQFEIDASLDQNPAARRGSQAGNNADGRGNHQRTGTGNHKHDETLVKPAHPISVREQRRNCGYQQGDDNHGRRVKTREAVDPLLHGSPSRSRFFHHADDPGQRGVTGRMAHPETERAIVVDGARVNLLSGSFHHRDRFAGDGRLVHAGISFRDESVQRNTFTRTNQYHLADLNTVHRFFVHIAVARTYDTRRCRGQIEQCFYGAPRPPDTP